MEFPQKQSNPEVSVVVPIYRNAGTIHRLLERLERVLNGLAKSYEIVCVVDACPEQSGILLASLAREKPVLRVLDLSQNIGQQRATLKGLAAAEGCVVVTMDGDLQDPPEAIPDLLNKLGEGYSAIFAGRRGAYESPLRLLTSKIFKRMLHALSGVPADSGAFVAMDRGMVDRLVAMKPSFPFLVAMIGITGLKTTAIPVPRSIRTQGLSAYSSWMRFKIGIRTLWWVILNKNRRAM